jgi:hypothetical protein
MEVAAMRGFTHLACVVSTIGAMCAGCSSTNVSVGAQNGAVAAYPSSIGNINTPRFALGDLVAVDPKTQKAWKFGSVEFAPTEVAVSQPATDSSELFDSTFDLSYSKKVNPILQDQVTETVRGQTALHVENYFTRSLKNPATFAVGSAPLARAVIRLHAVDPNANVFFVTSVTSADSVFLAYDGGEKNTAHFGKFDFHIDYPQNDQLQSLAKDAPAFFKMTALKVEEAEGRQTVAVDKSASEKLPADAVASLK